ncbi:UNVERIFIED_ORG: hypothetical protein J2W75_002335 [Methylorubrum zatmanii]|uniref:hypothetical protein n=1 Tax=Methylorubrum extorquens TaxID=408 RepID=UPI0020A1AE19|nr:hypothetical protein [Methylorubrum extorquens]MCP1558848.1 hypothetical protein [Methylorubrum extorquens]
MKAVVNTDQINKQNIKITLKALISGLEEHTRFSIKHGLPFGSPSFIAHDLTRLAGWSGNYSISLSKDMARHIAFIHYPANSSEQEELKHYHDKYILKWTEDRARPFIDELRERINSLDAEGASVGFDNCAVIIKNGLAAEMYPELFAPSTDFVDKDGLVYVDKLRNRFDEVQPGIFKDNDRKLLIFAHPYLRRRQSRKNTLNQYFLSKFSNIKGSSGTIRRLRLDPDMLGHPESLLHHLEFEYWHGPKFSDDVSSIPPGASEHKADKLTRFFETVDRTHLWWKSPESRTTGDGELVYRTFEAEELIEEPSVGLGEDVYGCRYVHAEYSTKDNVITHFDGAIRAYTASAFMERIDKNIDRAGKHAIYTKLFRFDGQISISDWKSLVVDYYRGNNLLPEYFGAQEETEISAVLEQVAIVPQLTALISFDRPEQSDKLCVVADEVCPFKDELVSCIDYNRGSCGALLESLVDTTNASLLICQDLRINFPRILLGVTDDIVSKTSKIAANLSNSISEDYKNGLVKECSIAISWTTNEIMTTFSVAGHATYVAQLLVEFIQVVDISKSAAEWIEALNERVKIIAPHEDGQLDPLSIITLDGRLRLMHHADENQPAELLVPHSTSSAG